MIRRALAGVSQGSMEVPNAPFPEQPMPDPSPNPSFPQEAPHGAAGRAGSARPAAAGRAGPRRAGRADDAGPVARHGCLTPRTRTRQASMAIDQTIQARIEALVERSRGQRRLHQPLRALRDPQRGRHHRGRRDLDPRGHRGARRRAVRRLRPPDGRGDEGRAGRAERRHDRRAPAVPERDPPLPAADRGRRGPPGQADRARRPGRQGADDQLQPAPGRLDREEVPGPGAPAARPDPGGHPRA